MDKFSTVKNAVEDLLGQGNISIIDSVFSENYIAHSGDRIYTGHAFIRKYAKQVRTAIADITILKVELLSHAENVITFQRTFCGTHRMSMKGIPASHKKVKWHEMVVSRFENGKIAEEWVASDLAFQLIIKQSKAQMQNQG